jgi:hypothetical protein
MSADQLRDGPAEIGGEKYWRSDEISQRQTTMANTTAKWHLKSQKR